MWEMMKKLHEWMNSFGEVGFQFAAELPGRGYVLAVILGHAAYTAIKWFL